MRRSLVRTQSSRRNDEIGVKRSAFMETTGVIIGAVLGLGLGVALLRLDLTLEARSWFSLPGELFIRALKCLVVPMVFVTLVVGMADLIRIGKASKIGWRSGVLFIFTSLVASMEGVFFALLFRSGISKFKKPDPVYKQPIVAFKCANGNFMAMNETTQMMQCTGNSTSSAFSQLEIRDINGVLQLKTTDVKILSFSDQLQGLFRVLVPDNITQAFADGTLLSVVMFAIPFGIALAHTGRHAARRRKNNSSAQVSTGDSQELPTRSPKIVNFVLEFMRQLNSIFLLLVRCVIRATPFAVVFLVGGAVLQQGNEDKQELLQNVGFFLATIISGAASHVLIVQPLLFFVLTWKNPYSYIKSIAPAQFFAFGCASSIATLPVTMRCVDESKRVSRSLSRFVLSIGATINMDGAALYFPAGIIFLVETSGENFTLGPVQLLSLVLISLVASVGGAPVPNAGLVLLVTVWKTITSAPIPDSFSYLVAIDWIADRFRTTVNVTGDAMVCGIIAGMVNETYSDEQLRAKKSRPKRRKLGRQSSSRSNVV